MYIYTMVKKHTAKQSNDLHLRTSEKGQVWWYIVIRTPRKLRQEDCKFKANLG
jgi:hypothetical protein